MTLEEEIAQRFIENNWTWKVKEKGEIIPDSDDIQVALDEAARVLYNEPVGTQLEVGRLIIVKKHRGHDVYLYVGPFD